MECWDSESSDDYILTNELKQGIVSALLFNEGRLMARKSSIIPGQQSIFNFETILYIGHAADFEEGDEIDLDTIDKIDAEINLLGVQSADIIMTQGGGSQKHPKPYESSLKNIKSY